MTTKSDAHIAALAAMFPAAFSAEPWREHRPLKVGIGNDLLARGVLGERKVNAALKRYVDRLMYQKCLAAGGAVLTSKIMLLARYRMSIALAPRGWSLASRRAS
jgi:sRNA-binding protein